MQAVSMNTSSPSFFLSLFRLHILIGNYFLWTSTSVYAFQFPSTLHSAPKTAHLLAFSGAAINNKDQPKLWLSSNENAENNAITSSKPANTPNRKKSTDRATVNFNMKLSSVAKKESAKQAQDMLEQMEELSQSKTTDVKDNSIVKPDSASYNIVMDAWIKQSPSSSSTHNAAQKVEDLFHKMETIYEREGANRNIKPDDVTYGILIDAWAKSAANSQHDKRGGGHAPPTRAEEVLKNMYELYHANPYNSTKPNVRHFNAVLNAWANISHRKRGASTRAESLLKRMEQMGEEENDADVGPDSRSYNIVIHSWANSGEKRSAEKAEKLLYRMERAYISGNQRVKPNVVSFNSVITAWGKSNELGSAQAAEDLLQRMENLYRVGGREEIKPDCVSYTAVIDAWAKSGERGAARRAEEILERMIAMYEDGDESVKPNSVTYNAVINAWVKSGEWAAGAASRAEDILETMETLYLDGDKDVKPNVRTYTNVIDAWSKSGIKGSVRRAEDIFQRMEELYKAGDSSVRPNVRTYTSIITAYARSKDTNKAQIAYTYLRNMEELYLAGHQNAKPNVYAYNAVMNACAYTNSGKAVDVENSFRTACVAFDELIKSDYGHPNHVTYGTFLRVCSKLLSNVDLRQRMVTSVFRRCCSDGMVGYFVLNQLKEVAPPDLYRELLGDRLAAKIDLTVKDLPNDWVCNVRESRRYW